MINKMLVSQRLELIGDWLKNLKKLSKLSYEEFTSNNLNSAAAESYLRRSLEAIFDIGRHILAKTGNLDMAGEYKSIAKGLASNNFVSDTLGEKLVQMAGYRNRMVHFYSMVTEKELYDILQDNLGDIEQFTMEIKQSVLKWL
ncbi:DUF86 domain-containing protein [Desulfallas sp. Bu1-1]|uniref:type VII toxin-antitoxin system HepT family RNase toxin n=1 Tax=Desulfallas sp. Bu1-1 TaxID=2787620 RepID=UPI00189DC750|nr:DUF86 domain-containing protein [Desulfallas sp. Bu1-1]MBF7081975.1 DUF86 domain-containing protein [Desulfallas sp. Bu1-1]